MPDLLWSTGWPHAALGVIVAAMTDRGR